MMLFFFNLYAQITETGPEIPEMSSEAALGYKWKANTNFLGDFSHGVHRDLHGMLDDVDHKQFWLLPLAPRCSGAARWSFGALDPCV